MPRTGYRALEPHADPARGALGPEGGKISQSGRDDGGAAHCERACSAEEAGSRGRKVVRVNVDVGSSLLIASTSALNLHVEPVMSRLGSLHAAR